MIRKTFDTMPGNFYCGLSGLALPFSKKDFPPEFQSGSRLTYYASLFNSIEINSSFYKLPQPSTVAKWVSEVPDDFRFTFKISKEITHHKSFVFTPEAVENFMTAIAPAGSKKGCILIQLPPSLTINHLNELQSLLSEAAYRNTQQWPLAVEFRNKSWYERETAELLKEFNASPVIQDLPSSATPENFITAAPEIYLRFHGPSGGYRGSYERETLERYALKVRGWLKEKRKVFCYFNNTIGDAYNNLQDLMALCGVRR